MKFFIFILFFAFVSCADSNTRNTELELESLKNQDYVWICYHPGTEYHNKLCIEEEFPNGCYVSGDRNKFCWILNKEDCSGKLLEEWQIINCPYLKGE